MTYLRLFNGQTSLIRLGSMLVMLLACAAGRPAIAQGSRSLPSDTYFLYFRSLHSGDYKKALDGFNDEIGGALKTVQSRWIDSICYYTMAGECYYRLGNLPKALESYNAALTVYVAYPTWMLQVSFPETVSPAAVKQVPWGQSKRSTKVGDYGSMRVQMGRLDNDEVIRKGGVVRAPYFISVNVHEVVRCTALAIRRRRELLGPVAAHDRLTEQVLSAASKRSSPPNHWSKGWSDLQFGMAMAAAGKTAQALGFLQSSLQVAGEFDHPMTGMTLLELGRLNLEAGDLAAAATLFEEATYSAAQYEDYSTIEEAFRFGQTTHLMANSRGVYPPLESAAAWSRNRSQELYASLLVLAAENVAVLGDSNKAGSLIGELRGRIARSSMAQTDIGSRMHYVEAMLNYRKGNSAEGDKLMSAAMQFYSSGSKWLFQIGLADSLYLSQTADIAPRAATQMYEILLRAPTAADWGMNPLECLAVLLTPHPGPFERWFEAALKRTGEFDESVEIADRARRHRFYSALPLGGRLLSLRWILEGPDEQLDKLALLQRQDLLARYDGYSKLADEAKKIREVLIREPLVAADQEEFKSQSALLAKLTKIGQAQEAILREIAVRREPAQTAFPPIRKTKDIQAAIPKGHLLLVFFSTSRNTYAFLYSNEKYARWQITAPGELQIRMANLFKAMGQVDPNRELTFSQLQDKSWRASALEVTKLLLQNSKVNLAEGCEELIVVPDGVLWHLPFELLQVGKSDDLVSLSTRSRVRYAPMASLALPLRHGRKENATTAVVLGKLYPRDEPEKSAASFEQLKAGVTGAVALSSSLPAPSPVYKSLFDGLIVLDDLNGTESAFGWSPIPLDKARAAGSLANWFSLPWGGPDYVILPGYHTAAETGLKRDASGEDIFLSACGLMATGTRTILLSRWRTGGQTSLDLVREFTQELPYSTAADAWQRSVQLVRESPINPSAEPRVKPSPQSELTTAEHPFFWAGYMLLDSGSLPERPNQPDAPGKLDFEKQAGMAKKDVGGPAEDDGAPDGIAVDPVEPANLPELPQAEPAVASSTVAEPAKGRSKSKGTKVQRKTRAKPAAKAKG